MATINFLYRSIKERAALNVRLLYRVKDENHKDFVLGTKTKLIVSKSYWNKQHNLQRVKDINIINKQSEISKELNKITNHILNAFGKIENPSQIKSDWLKHEVGRYYNPNPEQKKKPKDLISFIDYYISEKKDEVKDATRTKYRTVKKKMERLQASINETIWIKDVNENFKKQFKKFYQSESYSQNTMQREFAIVKTFCKYAAKGKGGLEVDPELDDLKFDKGEAINIFLSFEEIEQIESTELKHDYLINARDWLIISCFTGQRISDFMRFNKKMVRIEKGKHLIEFTQQKTGKLMTVGLHPKKILPILEKRNGEFPHRISDQRYNDYIKIVCEKAGIAEMTEGKKQINISDNKDEVKMRNVKGIYPKHELISSHIGRRSFATNFYGTIPTSLLKDATGHKTEEMFLTYLGKSNKDRAIELVNYF